MSSQAVRSPLGVSRNERRNRHPILAALDRVTPSQGWATFGLLIMTLLIVGESVEAAEWVDSTGLITLLLWSSVVGLVLAKVRTSWILLIPAGLIIGAMSLMWIAIGTVEGANQAERIRETIQRLDVWWDAASGGGISTDLLPFLIMLLAIGWVVGFLGSWFIFRRNNVWIAVVLLGSAILTNLSFLPDSFIPRFFLFVFFAMLLVVRLSIIQKHEAWKRLSIKFNAGSGWLTLHATLWLSVLVIALAILLPMRVYTNETVAQVWSIGRTPIATAEDFFARLFASLPSKKDHPGRLFGKWLPFIGNISFGGEPVGWATTEYPSYWMSQTYNYYSSKGWIATGTDLLEIGPDILPPPTTDNLKRESKDQVMQLGFATDKILIGGGYSWISHGGTVESLAPRKFDIRMSDTSEDGFLPDDIQELASEIRQEMRTHKASEAYKELTRRIPPDLLVLEVNADQSGFMRSFVLQRKAPTTPDLVAWNFSKQIQEHEAYRTISHVSVATDDDLRDAPAEYSGFVTDHYLQLPPTLPQRVKDLAERVTTGLDNPLDKTVAIRDYLRSPEFTYSQDIEAPPSDMDGVDWFLFESKAGYSDYYGSAMAVMLRAVGVPARMAAGYAPGELSEAGYRVIRDWDSHGWVQAYFPNYGWIDFEPTPKWPEHQRVVPPALVDELGVDTSGGGLEDIDPFLEEFDLLDELRGGVGRGVGGVIPGIDLTKYLIPIAAALGSAGVLWLVWSFIWNFGLGPLGPEAKLYAKLTRLGWLAGIGRRRGQTPIEYGRLVADVLPAVSEGAEKITTSYAVHRYGNRTSDEEAILEIADAWKSIRLRLAARVFERLVPLSGRV